MRPERIAADGHEISVQPVRFSSTGAGLLNNQVRDEFWRDAQDYSLDAPALIPRGSTQGHLSVPSIPDLEPWHYIDFADSRP